MTNIIKLPGMDRVLLHAHDVDDTARLGELRREVNFLQSSIRDVETHYERVVATADYLRAHREEMWKRLQRAYAELEASGNYTGGVA